MAKNPFSLLNNDTLRDIAEQASQLLPSDKAREQLQGHLHSLLQNSLSKLDVVSREEFEAQKLVLQKTRAKADKLEQQVNELLEKQQK